MTWDYLSEETDFRLWPVVGYLYGKFGTVVDLDCLEGRLSKYIPNKYIGNDVVDRTVKNFDFRKITDKQMADEIEECDYLCVFGYAKSDHELESHTLDESILTIVNKHKPKAIILECCDEYVINMKNIANKTMYKIAYEYKCLNNKKTSHTFATKRNLIILEK